MPSTVRVPRARAWSARPARRAAPALLPDRLRRRGRGQPPPHVPFDVAGEQAQEHAGADMGFAADEDRSHLLVAGVGNQIQKRTLQRALRELLETRIQLRIDPTHRRRGKAVAAKLLRHLRDLPNRNPANMHLHQCGNESFLRTLAALERTGAEHAVPVLGNAKLNLTDKRRQRTACSSPTVSPTDPRSVRSPQRPTPPSSLHRESPEACSGQDREPRRPLPPAQP